MKLTKKLILGFLAISVFSAIVGYVGFVSMTFVNAGFQDMSDKTLPTMLLLEDLKASMHGVFTATIESALIVDANGTAHFDEEKASRDLNMARFEKSLNNYSKSVDAYFPEEKAYREDIRKKWGVFIGVSDNILALKQGGASEREIIAADKDFEEAREELEESIGEAIALESAEAEEKKNAVQGTIRSSLIAIVIIIILSVISAAISGAVFARSIAEPVIELTRISSDVKGRYLGVKKANAQSDDEIGVLANTFNTMVEDLKKRDFEISLKNKELEKSKKDLEEKVSALEQFNKLAVGRELKMIELKKRIAELGGKK